MTMSKSGHVDSLWTPYRSGYRLRTGYWTGIWPAFGYPAEDRRVGAGGRQSRAIERCVTSFIPSQNARADDLEYPADGPALLSQLR